MTDTTTNPTLAEVRSAHLFEEAVRPAVLRATAQYERGLLTAQELADRIVVILAEMF